MKDYSSTLNELTELEHSNFEIVSEAVLEENSINIKAGYGGCTKCGCSGFNPITSIPGGATICTCGHARDLHV